MVATGRKEKTLIIVNFKGGTDKIGLNQNFMLIDKKKDAHRGRYRRFAKIR